MVKPVKMSLTKKDIFIGASKSPIVTELTANRDCVSSRIRQLGERITALSETYQLVDQRDHAMQIILDTKLKAILPLALDYNVNSW